MVSATESVHDGLITNPNYYNSHPHGYLTSRPTLLHYILTNSKIRFLKEKCNDVTLL